MINQLIRSGKVWALQDFFETYCPDSHLLKDFPKDRKLEYIRQYGDWYAYLSHLNTDDARKTWKERPLIMEIFSPTVTIMALCLTANFWHVQT